MNITAEQAWFLDHLPRIYYYQENGDYLTNCHESRPRWRFDWEYPQPAYAVKVEELYEGGTRIKLMKRP